MCRITDGINSVRQMSQVLHATRVVEDIREREADKQTETDRESREGRGDRQAEKGKRERSAKTDKGRER